jgi:hypothetical protein
LKIPQNRFFFIKKRWDWLLNWQKCLKRRCSKHLVRKTPNRRLETCSGHYFSFFLLALAYIPSKFSLNQYAIHARGSINYQTVQQTKVLSIHPMNKTRSLINVHRMSTGYINTWHMCGFLGFSTPTDLYSVAVHIGLWTLPTSSVKSGRIFCQHSDCIFQDPSLTRW